MSYNIIFGLLDCNILNIYLYIYIMFLILSDLDKTTDLHLI